jgi:thymidine kinase
VLELIGGADLYCCTSRSAFFEKLTEGKIHLTIGRVKSGKTTQLLRVLRRHAIAKRSPMLLRSPTDDSINDVPFAVITAETLPNPVEVAKYDIIGLDEAQWFSNIAQWADEMANIGTLVEVSAVDGDCERGAFPNVAECVSICDQFQKLNSISQITGLPAQSPHPAREWTSHFHGSVLCDSGTPRHLLFGLHERWVNRLSVLSPFTGASRRAVNCIECISVISNAASDAREAPSTRMTDIQALFIHGSAAIPSIVSVSKLRDRAHNSPGDSLLCECLGLLNALHS